MLALLPLALLGMGEGPTLESQLPALLDSMRASIERDMNRFSTSRPVPMRMPANPCMEDMKRLRCTDSTCLKRAAETLAPECAGLLLGAPEPSPSPEVHRPVMMASLSGTSMRELMGSVSFSSKMPSGESVPHISSLISGPMVPRSATISSRPMPMDAHAMAMLQSFFPPELSAVLRMMPMAIEMEEPQEEAHEEEHPCMREMAACARETGDRSPLDCLVRHIDALSPECKCFVHHHTNGRYASAPRPTNPIAISVRTVPLPAAREATINGEVVVEPMPPPEEAKGVHRLSCLFVFTALFLLSFMLARACIVLLCCSATSRRVVVVPPEHAKITTVGPLISAEIVQVATPAKKATKA